jgi:hypothetical protein
MNARRIGVAAVLLAVAIGSSGTAAPGKPRQPLYRISQAAGFGSTTADRGASTAPPRGFRGPR